MSSKKYAKTNQKKPAPVENSRASHNGRSPAFVWGVRIVIVLLCVAVAVTLIPSAFF